MTISFFDFTMAVTEWLSTAPDEARERLRPSSWKSIYSTAERSGDHLVFSPEAIGRIALDGRDDLQARVAVPLARMLNQRFGGRDDSAEEPPDPEQQGASDAPAPASAPTPMPRSSLPPVPPPPPMPTSAPAPAEPPAAAPSWVFPAFDYSREDRDEAGVEGGTHYPVNVQRVDGALFYRWDDAGEDEVYRVVVSDTEEPYNPDDFDEVAVTEDLEARDTTPPTTAVRFVTVWGYTRPANGTGVLGQGRRVASAVVIHPLDEWSLSFNTMSRAVEGRWAPPSAPTGGRVTVQTARLPVDENVGRLIRSMAWLSYMIPNNGAGFQDSDGLIGGRKHTYVAAVEVTVAGSTYTSTPQIAHITPEVIREAVADLHVEQQVETVAGVQGTVLTVTWTQNPLSDVVVYRTTSPVDAPALAQGNLATSQLAGAGLEESDAITSAAGLSQTDDPNRQLRTLEKVIWPEGDQWDTIHLTPVTRHEDGTSTIGAPVQLKRAGGIQNATLLRRGSWDLVTFTWPGEATSVELRTFPAEQPFDPDVPPLVSVSQDRYRTEGGCVVPGGLPAEGATVYLNSLTYHEGKQISSPPVDLEAPPLWRYEYTLRWPLMNRVLGIGNLFGALVEIEVVARAGIKKQEDAASVSLIHNPDHFPLHAGDGNPVSLYLERPTKDGGQQTCMSVLLPPDGTPLMLWFNPKDIRPGYVRLLVNAGPAVTGRTGTPGMPGRALESYALADPALDLLRKR